MGQRSKNHHFVPQVLQKQFAAERDRIWYSGRGNDGKFAAPKLKKIEKCFRIRDLYTVLSGDERSDIVEREFYAKIDDYLGQLLPRVLGAFDKGEVPTFSGEPLDSLRKVVLEMAKRTPEFTEKYDDVALGRELVESTLAAMEEGSSQEDRLKLLADLANPSRLREFGRNVRVRATINRSEKIEGALEDFSVRWVVSETRHSFILSSLMVYRIGNGGPNGLSNPNTEIWMPIAPKIALVLVRDKNRNIPLRVSDSAAHIRQVNEYAVRSSRQIASHSQQLIESLTGKRAQSS